MNKEFEKDITGVVKKIKIIANVAVAITIKKEHEKELGLKEN